MVERIPGSELYVTHEKMNSYLTWVLGGAVGMIGSVICATWFLNDRISEIRQDVAVVKVRVESLSKVTEIKDGDVQQAQYVLVETPTRTARDELIRQVLLKKGEIDGTP